MNRYFIILIFIISCFKGYSQPEKTLEKIFNEALTSRVAYNQLEHLCEIAPGRISGTLELNKAIEYTYDVMQNMPLDTVYLQTVKIPNWKRGAKEIAYVDIGNTKTNLSICTLGNAIGTGTQGLTAPVVEISQFSALNDMAEHEIRGKIVFLNEPMDASAINTFQAYGSAGTQRFYGAAKAAEKGAVGVIIRSATTELDDFPHTGVMRYTDENNKIPAVSISTIGAETLHQILADEPKAEVYFRTTCSIHPDTLSYNVIGELRGTEFPEKIITVGGHIDSWFNGEGAHDDGAGCIHSIEMLRLFTELGIRPRHTIRAVMFVDEEIAQRGGQKYAAEASRKKEQHVFALESDRGGFIPRGFTIDADSIFIQKIQTLTPYFVPYGIYEIIPGYGGVDINPLKKYDVPVAGFLPDWQRYFKYHHAGTDVFEEVNIRELQMGSAAIASFIYLLDHQVL